MGNVAPLERDSLIWRVSEIAIGVSSHDEPTGYKDLFVDFLSRGTKRYWFGWLSGLFLLQVLCGDDHRRSTIVRFSTFLLQVKRWMLMGH